MTNKNESPTFHIYTDGACKKNPGGIGGWGAVVTDFVSIKEYFGGELSTTNNRMEMMAVIKGLESIPRGSKATVFTDSQYVKNGITQWIHGWKRRGWMTAGGDPVKNKDLWIQMDILASKLKLTWQWVKGHNGDPGNERADVLANKGVDSIRGSE
jgi:ribonuclease HI